MYGLDVKWWVCYMGTRGSLDDSPPPTITLGHHRQI